MSEPDEEPERTAGVSHQAPGDGGARVDVRSRWWVPTALLAATPLLMATLLLVPETQREGSDTEVLLLVAGTALALGAILVGAYVVRGSDRFAADDLGLHLRSRRRGNQSLAWDDLVELGWVVGSRYASGGLAGRRREGGSHEPGGPNIAGWLAQPVGRVQPREALGALQRLCATHGVAWKDYAPAEVL